MQGIFDGEWAATGLIRPRPVSPPDGIGIRLKWRRTGAYAMATGDKIGHTGAAILIVDRP